PPARPEPLLQGADLRIGRLLAADRSFENLRLQLKRQEDEWLLSASGPAVEGSLRWPLQPAGRAVYRAELQRLQLRAPQRSPEAAEAAVAADESPPRDPAQLPGLSLRCRSLRVNGHELGQLQLEAVPVPNGLALSTFSLKGELEMQGSGSWTRVRGESSAQLSLGARGRGLRPLFEALGYAPSLDAEKIRLQASLAWAPHAGGLKTELLGGGFSLDLEKGVLMAVEPGAGRVLGLLNFYALPRRLTLDFRDVVSKGLAFDTLKGDFRIEQGNAWTDNLKINGPSLKMEIEGRVGLAARDYDQKVTIHPQLSPGVALAGTLAGGPAVGLGILLAQQLFKKPIEDMSELSYRLRGPWDNPTIDKDG
ncbi:MAG TPA: AsmA-like C-terminal region-containing protein, partial [Nevskiales bacterium]|nr:AsmA-like C-terminal region-containing protein [Nevskiales bacterium]